MKIYFFIFSVLLLVLSEHYTSNAEINKESLKAFFPSELLEKYDEYQTLEEYEKTCNLENLIKSNDEKYVKYSLMKNECIPSPKSLTAILENGWFDISRNLIKEYLEKKIDPTFSVYNFYNKEENKLQKIKYLLADVKYENLSVNPEFNNYDNTVKLKLRLPDASYVAEYVSIFCYKDMLKINAIFKSRNKFYKYKDKKILYDQVSNECESNYNSFDHVIEITMNKINKLKKWETVFK